MERDNIRLNIAKSKINIYQIPVHASILTSTMQAQQYTFILTNYSTN